MNNIDNPQQPQAPQITDEWYNEQINNLLCKIYKVDDVAVLDGMQNDPEHKGIYFYAKTQMDKGLSKKVYLTLQDYIYGKEKGLNEGLIVQNLRTIFAEQETPVISKQDLLTILGTKK